MKVGADPDGLQATARELSAAADQLDSLSTSIGASFVATEWHGPDATQSRDEWTGRHRGRVEDAVRRLREVSGVLERNAEAQRRTSEADGPVSGPGVGPGTGSGGGGAGGGSDGGEPDVDTLREQAASVVDAPSQAQTDWWNGLTPAEQNALVEKAPTTLLLMAGLPPAAHALAEASAANQVRGGITIASDKLKAEASVEAWFVDLGVEGSATVAEAANGTTKVTFQLGGNAGAQFGQQVEAEAGLKGSAATVYEFSSRAEAEEFLAGLRDELTAVGDDVLSTNPVGNYVGDVTGYLDRFEGDHKGYVIEGGVYATVEAEAGGGAGQVSAGGELMVSYDTSDGSTTLKGKIQASGDLAGGELSIAGDSSAALKLDDDGRPVSLNLSSSFSGSGSAAEQFMRDFTGEMRPSTDFVGDMPDASPGNPRFGIDATAGAKVALTQSFDLTDPYIAGRAEHLVSAIQSGDMATAARELAAIENLSTTTAQVTTFTSEKASVDIAVAEGSIEMSGTANVVAVTRLPGGSDYVVTAGATPTAPGTASSGRS